MTNHNPENIIQNVRYLDECADHGSQLILRPFIIEIYIGRQKKVQKDKKQKNGNQKDKEEYLPKTHGPGRKG